MKAQLLFVDDDRKLLATMGEGLRQAGYGVKTAESGMEAIELAASSAFDLAIVDICMPEMSGFELAEILRDQHQVATLFLSAYSDPQHVDVVVNTVGGIGYLVKPVTVQQLIPPIETGIYRSRELRALLSHNHQLERALKGDRRISTAVGILMERHKLDQKAAFELLRKKARTLRSKLIDCAEKLMSSTMGLKN